MIDLNKIAIVAGSRSVTYGELFGQVARYALLTPKGKETKTVILSENRQGWVYAFFSVWLNEGIAVPVDASSTADDVAYILRDCRPDAVWVSKEKEPVLAEALRLVRKADLQDVGGQREGESTNWQEPQVLLLDEQEEDASGPLPLSLQQGEGEKAARESFSLPWTALSEPDNDDTAVIIYTSGTTGSPKGVMLSYANLMANVRSVSQDVPIYNDRRRALVLLPLHHVLPLMGSLIAPLYMGAGIAICPSLSGADIMETLNRGKVAIIIGVPRLWQTLYRTMKQRIDAHFLTRFLFWLCEKAQSRALSRFIFKSIRTKMGGHITYCVSGGAALDLEIGKGLKTLGLDVLEGYGMTEAAPVIAFTRPDDIRPGCAGKALPAVQCELRNGELYAKGRNIMQGYYHRPEETAAVLQDGWLRTGDLATIDKDGHITITGRTKEIIVLSNGKNVNPAELEYRLEKFTEQVKEAAVLPDGDKLCAILVPQAEWAKGKDDAEQEERLKEEVLQPYNQTVEPYKKVMSLFVYHGDLPRTKLDKLQRFKLASLLQAGVHSAPKPQLMEPTFEEYRLIKQYILKEKHLDELRPTDNLETDLAFDSLDNVGLQGFLQNTFGLDLTVEAMGRFRHITELAEYVANFKTQMEMAEVDWHSILHEEHPDVKLPDTWPTGPWIVQTFKTFFKMQFRLAAKGVKNIPADRSFILAANHQSYLDGMFVMSYVQRQQIRNTYFFAKEKHVNTPVRRWLASRHNVVVLEQNNMKRSIGKLGDVLRQGKNLIIFPEGTRTADGNLGEFKKMFAILSVELQVPIVPVVIHGAFEALPRGKKWPLPKKIMVEYLPPVCPTA